MWGAIAAIASLGLYWLLSPQSRIAGISADERRRPQTGTFRSRDAEGATTVWSVKTSGSTAGERVVLVANEKGQWELPVDQLGMTSEQLTEIKKVTSDTKGLVIVAGPRSIDRAADNLWVGWNWADQKTPSGRDWCVDDDDGTWTYADPRAPGRDLEPVSDRALRRAIAQIENDASGWETDVGTLGSEAEPADPQKGRIGVQPDVHRLPTRLPQRLRLEQATPRAEDGAELALGDERIAVHPKVLEPQRDP